MAENVYVSQHPLVAHKLTMLREKTQKPKKFRELVREISILLACEATADLKVAPVEIETPLEPMESPLLTEKIGLVPVLRAGLGMVEGIWELMPGAEVWHIGLKRDERTLQPVQYYANKPVAPVVSVCLLLDPMLATGGSASAACSLLKEWGVNKIKFIGLLAAPEGVATLQKDHPDIDIHIAAIDRELNEKAYILPGLGDAGDRLFGTS